MANYNRPTNAFPKGNHFHKQVADPGRKKLFSTPDDLWQAARKYFEFCVDNPLPHYVVRRGRLVIQYRMHGMSLNGLILFLGIGNLDSYKKRLDFEEVVDRIHAVIFVHNFTGAAVGLLEGRIIYRK